MLFNSYEFVCLFLPITLAGFIIVGRRLSREWAFGWLTATSLFYYGWWNPKYLILIIGSIAANYFFGRILGEAVSKRRAILALGVTFNLAILAYFKYAGFIVLNMSALTGSAYSFTATVLPLAISFFTFQQIAYLVDAYRGETREYNILHYSLFVSFFPQLIAGPIVHHKEMLPQFEEKKVLRISAEDFSIGLSMFVIGLFKKVVLADNVAVFASPVFAAAESGASIGIADAWVGALCYTLQLYFDFSGYSDMAIGLARLFGIRLPANFDSPYKAKNIIEFWRRWHITLSRFLRDYLYIALGGNRRGKIRRYANLIVTMTLGGLWHGAGWTFVLWGVLHGIYLIVNHGWHVIRGGSRPKTRIGVVSARALTFLAVVLGWVFFRSGTFDGAIRLLGAMIGQGEILMSPAIGFLQPALGGTALFTKVWLPYAGSPVALIWILVLLPVVFFAPNTQELLCKYRPTLERRAPVRVGLPSRSLIWRPTVRWAMFIAGLTVLALDSIRRTSEFLYYQF